MDAPNAFLMITFLVELFTGFLLVLVGLFKFSPKVSLPSTFTPPSSFSSSLPQLTTTSIALAAASPRLGTPRSQSPEREPPIIPTLPPLSEWKPNDEQPPLVSARLSFTEDLPNGASSSSSPKRLSRLSAEELPQAPSSAPSSPKRTPSRLSFTSEIPPPATSSSPAQRTPSRLSFTSEIPPPTTCSPVQRTPSRLSSEIPPPTSPQRTPSRLSLTTEIPPPTSSTSSPGPPQRTPSRLSFSQDVPPPTTSLTGPQRTPSRLSFSAEITPPAPRRAPSQTKLPTISELASLPAIPTLPISSHSFSFSLPSPKSSRVSLSHSTSSLPECDNITNSYTNPPYSSRHSSRHSSRASEALPTPAEGLSSPKSTKFHENRSFNRKARVQLIIVGFVNIIGALFIYLQFSLNLESKPSQWVTYVQWIFTTPPMTIVLCMICQIDYETTFSLAVVTGIVMACGFVSAGQTGAYLIWPWFGIGVLHFLFLFGVMIHKKRQIEANMRTLLLTQPQDTSESDKDNFYRDVKLSNQLIVLTMVTWSIYPIIFIISKNGSLSVITVEIAHAVLEFAAKITFGLTLAWYKTQLGYTSPIIKMFCGCLFPFFSCFRFCSEQSPNMV